MICLTAIIGEYDEPKPAPKGIESHMFSDRPRSDAEALGWKVHLRNNNTLSGRYVAKAPKCAPHLLGFTDPDVLWLDGSIRPTGEDIQEMFDMVPVGGIGTFKHRERDCVFIEATYSALAINRYAGQPVLQQADFYHSQGMPEGWGLYEVGVIAWRGAQFQIGERWLAEQLVWSSQDQISFPYVCWKNDTRPTILPGSSVLNKWTVYEHHKQYEW